MISLKLENNKEMFSHTCNKKKYVVQQCYLLSSLQIVHVERSVIVSRPSHPRPFSIAITSPFDALEHCVRNTMLLKYYSPWEYFSSRVNHRKGTTWNKGRSLTRARVVLTLDIFWDGDLDLRICRVPLERKRRSLSTYKIVLRENVSRGWGRSDEALNMQ